MARQARLSQINYFTHLTQKNLNLSSKTKKELAENECLG